LALPYSNNIGFLLTVGVYKTGYYP